MITRRPTTTRRGQWIGLDVKPVNTPTRDGDHQRFLMDGHIRDAREALKESRAREARNRDPRELLERTRSLPRSCRV